MSIDIPTALDPAPVTYGNPATDPVGTVRVHPDHDPRDPDAFRLGKVAVASAAEWPWRRWPTGLPTLVPAQGSDIATWPVQPLGDLALVLGHATILTGREVVTQ